jgi:DNA-binding SARP family transcriptional activator/tetratricopeptide (TPR) repeat protein
MDLRMPLSEAVACLTGNTGVNVNGGSIQYAQDLEFSVLGPLEVRRGGRRVEIRGKREQAVLATLLLADGETVTVDRIVQAVWDDEPPQNAIKAVRNCISLLRLSLAEPGGADRFIESATSGYRTRLADCALDARAFKQQAEGARRLAACGQTAVAADELRAALGLWRGPALAGIRGRLVEAGGARLDEQRMTVLEECLDLELTLGRHRQVLGELRGLAAEYPLRERIAGQLMLAQYRSGRQADALDTFNHLAKRLVDELGIDPSAPLAQLYEAILRQDASLGLAPEQEPTAGEGLVPPGTGGPPPQRAESPNALPRPAQLPLEVPHFTGRKTELARLHALVCGAGDSRPPTTAVVITAIAGTAGIGKTALAIRFAYQVADRYPDGQLYVNLRGFDPSGPAVTPHEALLRFLIALGVAPEEIPPETADQELLYRSLLAGKRVLFLLDNASDAAQVRPLLPGSPGCLVLVTSRNQLTGLVAAQGAVPLTLEALTSQEAQSLLAGRLGADRIEAETGAARELISLCGRLPLALVIVAARAGAQPRLGLADLAAELRNTRSRLDGLRTDDPATDIRTVFSWSYRRLGDGVARMFRLLSVHPGPDITSPAAASLADIQVPEARGLLSGLASCNLIIENAPGRYVFHDLLRAYATDLTTASEALEARRDAVGRLFDYYLATAAAAMDVLSPVEALRRPPQVTSHDIPGTDLADAHAALAWLDAERACLVMVAAHAATHGWPAHAIRLSATLERYLQGGHYAEGLSVHGHARDAARGVGDHGSEASAARALGVVYWMLGSREQSSGQLRQALALYRAAADQAGQARCLTNLGGLEADQGHYTRALDFQERSLALFRAAGDRPGESVALNNLADVLLRAGGEQQACVHLQQALVLSRQDGDRYSEAHVLQTLGEAEQRCGQLQQAAERYRQALAIFSELGNRRGQAWVAALLGTVSNHIGCPDEAADRHRQAITMSRGGGDRDGEAVALNGLGEAVYAAGRPGEALSHHLAALDLASGTGNTVQQARARVGLGHCHDALDRPLVAREQFRHAAELYDSLGYPDAQQIRTRLAGASAGYGSASAAGRDVDARRTGEGRLPRGRT